MRKGEGAFENSKFCHSRNTLLSEARPRLRNSKKKPGCTIWRIFCCTLGYVPPYQICANLSNSALPPLSLSLLSSCLLLATASDEASKGLLPKRRLLLCMDQGRKEKEDGTLHIFKKGSPILLHASTFAHNLHTYIL